MCGWFCRTVCFEFLYANEKKRLLCDKELLEEKLKLMEQEHGEHSRTRAVDIDNLKKQQQLLKIQVNTLRGLNNSAVKRIKSLQDKIESDAYMVSSHMLFNANIRKFNKLYVHNHGYKFIPDRVERKMYNKYYASMMDTITNKKTTNIVNNGNL
jgi:hypothetical protein